MNGENLKYLYGPVPSWRLGRSLGVDVLSQADKICNFDCVYCQLGRTAYCPARRVEFVDAKDIAGELASLPAVELDYVTFSGRGEATLASNLGQTLAESRQARKEQTALITNSVLLADADVRKETAGFDFVVAKLDACDDALLNEINRPVVPVKMREIVSGLCAFRAQYGGRLAIQTMFIEANASEIENFSGLYAQIKPDEIEVNTPLRPSPVQPLPQKRLADIADALREKLPGMKIKTVYEAEKPDAAPISGPETLRRRGKI
ncbi:MAG: radical SAM protein [Elusimicrobia bacterium]|nr:radical SAM protein [Elusimicrobiota bacterium]